jgi:hypothetical protein
MRLASEGTKCSVATLGTAARYRSRDERMERAAKQTAKATQELAKAQRELAKAEKKRQKGGD